MHLSCAVLILAILLKENACTEKRSNVARPETAAELAKLIHLVNRLKGKPVTPGDRDLVTDLTKKVIQASDVGSTQTVPGARFHYILNPDALQEYRNIVKAGPQHYYVKNPEEIETFKKEDEMQLSLADDDNADTGLKRRNAVFRFDGASKPDDSQRKQETINNPHSLEQDKYFRKKKEPQFNNENKNQDLDNSKGRFDNDFDYNKNRKNSKIEENQDNAWDVITKKYNWEDERKSKYKYNDDLPDKHKETKDKFKKDRDVDDWDKKTPKPDKQKTFNKAEGYDWDLKITKQDNYNEREKSYDNWPKKKKDKWNSGEKQTTKRDKWNSSERNMQAKKDKWNSGEKNRPIKKYRWNSGERNRSNKKNKWDSSENRDPIKKIKYPETNSAEKPKRNIYDEVTTFKTTRKWTKESGDWKNAAAQSQYDKPKRSRHSFDSGGGGFYGRTPIPFVGKKGIYEET